MGHPSVYPTGATLYDPQRAWSGYTLFQATEHGAGKICSGIHRSRAAMYHSSSSNAGSSHG
ncbi:hypothetical protein V7P28_43620, partial [Klebsiella michiganensis]